jgi:hypothetical protein
MDPLHEHCNLPHRLHEDSDLERVQEKMETLTTIPPFGVLLSDHGLVVSMSLPSVHTAHQQTDSSHLLKHRRWVALV